MDFLQSLRVRNTLANMFKPDPSQAQNQQQDQPNQPQIDPMIANLQAMMTPQNEANERLKQILNTVPNRADYQPTGMQRVMAGLSGLSASGAAGQANGQLIGYKGMGKEGQDIIQNNLNRPYNQAMADWNAQIKPAGELADAERYQNTNARLTANTILRDQNADAEHERKTAADKSRDENEKAKLEERYAHLAYLKEKAVNPNNKPMSDKDGYLFIPQPDGTARYMVDDNGDKIKSDKLPEMLKMEVQQNNEMTRIGARGSEARKTVAAQGEKEVNVSDKTLTNKKELKATVPGKNTASVEGSGAGANSKTMVRVIRPDGKHGSIPANQVNDAIKQGYKVIQ